MRLKGKLIEWNSQKAFGFISPNGGGENVFIHKTGFENRQRVPKINDIITFSITKDKKGRYCAEDAIYSGEKLIAKKTKGGSKFSISVAVIFMAALLIMFVLGHMSKEMLWVYWGISVITFLIYAYDKRKAKRHAWRTPESTLHLLSLLGGWPGALVAQQLLRHKSKKKRFRFIFWLTAIANCTALAWILMSEGII